MQKNRPITRFTGDTDSEMDERKSYVLIFIAGCLWGVQGLFMKLLGAAGSTSLFTSFGRIFLGFLIMLVITLIKGGPKALKVSRRTLISCILLGIFCQAMYNYAYSSAVAMVGMAMASVLLYTAPVFASIYSKIFFKERFTGQKVIALVMNVAGCILVITGGHFENLSLNTAGVIFGILSGVTYALVPIFGRTATDGETSDPFAVSTYNFLFGAIALGLFRPWVTVADPLSPDLIKPLIMLAFFSTVLPYLLYYTGLRSIKESSKVPVIASIEMVVATLLGVLVFHETMGIGNIIGIFILLASIALTSLGKVV